MRLKVKKLVLEAIVPEYASAGAGCFDLHAVIPLGYSYVHPGEAMLFSTGLAFEVPTGHVMLVFSRSGHGFKNGIRLANCVGVIDSDYRGEVKVKLTSDHHNSERLRVAHGDRIAQAMVLPIERAVLLEVDELSDTERGDGGFGSTGGTGEVQCPSYGEAGALENGEPK